MAARTGWIAHYVFQAKDGEVRTMTTRLVAASRQEAMDLAAEAAPSEDFVVQIHAESEDQFLGHVRNTASKVIDPQPFDPKKFEEQNDEAEKLIESLLQQLQSSRIPPD